MLFDLIEGANPVTHEEQSSSSTIFVSPRVEQSADKILKQTELKLLSNKTYDFFIRINKVTEQFLHRADT